MSDTSLSVEILPDLASIGEDEWNRLAGTANPFIQYAFLHALEVHGCVGEEFGWYPCHLAIRDGASRLVAAMPMYVKTNYYGEFVFDWNWDQAYRRSGLDYYPKLVVSIPYTPASGPRLLVDPDTADPAMLKDLLIAQAQRVARENHFSSVHWLFTDSTDTAHFQQRGFTLRMGCNYHWHNNHYQSFEDFLNAFSAKKRKNVKRERRAVAEQGLRLQRFHGTAISDALMDTFAGFYASTFDKKSGLATLNAGFFRAVRDTLGERLILAVAFKDNEAVAAAMFFQGDKTLFGRYWGCREDYHSLHFETCYYQGLELAIEQNLAHCDPGVQGEHKIARGFLPTATWSAHWLADKPFGQAVERYCRQELEAMQERCSELMTHSPYRNEATPPSQGLQPSSPQDEAGS